MSASDAAPEEALPHESSKLRLEKIAESLNLTRAWRRVKRNSRGDPIPTTIEYAVFQTHRDDNLNSLKEAIGQGLLTQPLKTVNLVKANLTLRPCALPEIPDRIYYQALVNHIADQVDNKLFGHESGVVFGFRLNPDRSEDMFSEESSYSDFYKRVKQEVQEGDKFMLVTDIASYYETVDHSTLRSILVGLGADEDIVNELMRILGLWSNNTGRGLPQSLWASDYLGARIYLDRIDKAMLRSNYLYFRYSDDICVFAPSEIELRKALRDLVLELRRCQLFVQGAKTRIYSPAEAQEEVSRLRTRAQPFLDRGLAWTLEIPLYGYPAEPAEEQEITEEELLSSEPVLLGLFEEERGQRDPDAIILRRCLHGLRRLRSREGVEPALDLLGTVPSLTQDIMRYLKAAANFDDVKDRLIALLKSESNIYPWQEMWVLDYLYWAPANARIDSPFSEDDLRTIADMAFDRNRHWACRVSAIGVLGRNGDDAYRTQIRDLYNEETHPDVRHAIIRACMRLPNVDRNRFLKACIGQDTRTDRIITYLRDRASGSP